MVQCNWTSYFEKSELLLKGEGRIREYQCYADSEDIFLHYTWSHTFQGGAIDGV